MAITKGEFCILLALTEHGHKFTARQKKQMHDYCVAYSTKETFDEIGNELKKIATLSSENATANADSLIQLIKKLSFDDKPQSYEELHTDLKEVEISNQKVKEMYNILDKKYEPFLTTSTIQTVAGCCAVALLLREGYKRYHKNEGSTYVEAERVRAAEDTSSLRSRL